MSFQRTNKVIKRKATTAQDHDQWVNKWSLNKTWSSPPKLKLPHLTPAPPFPLDDPTKTREQLLCSLKAPSTAPNRLLAKLLFRYSEVLNRLCPCPKMFSKSVVLVVLVLATSAIVSAFPDGAPADTCVNANSPKHGKTLPRANHTLPYQLVASSDQFGPGAEVQG